MSLDQIVAILGEPDFDLFGEYFNYSSLGLQLVLTGREPDKLGMIIANPSDAASRTRNDFPGQTDKGIRIGSTRREVLEAYGQPDPSLPEDNATNPLFRYNKLGLMFSFWEHKVLQIFAGRTD